MSKAMETHAVSVTVDVIADEPLDAVKQFWRFVDRLGRDEVTAVVTDHSGQQYGVVAGRTYPSDPDTCQACERPSLECSQHPCPQVVADRGESPAEQVIGDVNEHYRRDHGPEFVVPFQWNESRDAWDITINDTTIRLADDDGTVLLYVFTAGRAMLLSSEARFTYMPSRIVASVVAQLIDTALTAEEV